jgi:Asp/Glu/hydantoin racemase
MIKAIQSLCDRAVEPGTTVEVRGTTHGALGDQYRLFWHYDVREVLDNALKIRKSGGYDAFLVGNSLDPGIVELRELLDIPVLTFMEVGCHVACMMGERFGLISLNERMIPRYREIVVGYGLRHRLAAIEAVEVNNIRSLDAIFADRDAGAQLVEETLRASRRAIAQGSEVIIATGPLTALLGQHGVNEIDGVPLLDVQSYLAKMGEVMVKMKKLTGVHVSRRMLYEAPSEAMFKEVAKVRGIPT